MMTGDGKLRIDGRKKTTDSVACDSWLVTRFFTAEHAETAENFFGHRLPKLTRRGRKLG
jgi:hypothetical protein